MQQTRVSCVANTEWKGGQTGQVGRELVVALKDENKVMKKVMKKVMEKVMKRVMKKVMRKR